MTEKEKTAVKLSREYHDRKITFMSIIKDLFMWRTTPEDVSDDQKS